MLVVTSPTLEILRRFPSFYFGGNRAHRVALDGPYCFLKLAILFYASHLILCAPTKCKWSSIERAQLYTILRLKKYYVMIRRALYKMRFKSMEQLDDRGPVS